MTWLSDGEPTHRCPKPVITEWVRNRPEDGYAAHEDWQTEREPARHVFPGAQWRCDNCGVIYKLNDQGQWEQE